VDGNAQDRRGTVSVFDGPAPTIETFDDPEQEAEAVGAWITGRVEQGVQPHEIGVFVRSTRELRRARNTVKQAGVSAVEISDKIEVTPGKLSIGTMHLAKRLEFRAVAVIACDDEIIPLQERIENVADDADLEEVYDSERHLLYVACTRARDHLLVTGVKLASEFLDDLATANIKPAKSGRPRSPPRCSRIAKRDVPPYGAFFFLSRRIENCGWVRDRGDTRRLSFRGGACFGIWHGTAHLGRRLVFAQPLIDDLAQEIVVGPGQEFNLCDQLGFHPMHAA
jgi:hypothetical protein